MSRRSRALRRCLAAAATCLLALPAGAAALPGDPDLVADPPELPFLEQDSEGGAPRLLLRFDGFVHNRGPSALEFRGSQPAFPNMQRVEQSVGGTPVQRNATIKFETNDDHNHFHLMEIARYSLWNAFRTAEAAPAMKVGFCLLDSEPVEADENEFPTYLNESFCQAGNRRATGVMMGVSAGWRDIYPSDLAFQWVDVSDVQPGIYWLRSEIDPDGFVREQDEVNPAPFAASASTIPGYVAQPIGGTLTAGRSTTVTLRANSFGNAGQRQFRIDVPPTCGDLDRPTGAWSSDATVTYTPGPGCSRSDGFQFSARDATSAFPRNPTRAGVLLAATAPGPQPPGPGPTPPGPGPTPPPGPGPAPAPFVMISGAPPKLATGLSAQLSAAVSNGSQAVTWSVDGVRGGSSRVGTITGAGRYTAPRSVPAGRFVSVQARHASGASASVRIEITKRAAQTPAISPKPRVALSGRRVHVRTKPSRTVRVLVKVMRGRKTVGGCRKTLVRAGRSYLCRARVKRGVRLTKLKVRVTMTVGKRTVSKRTLSVPRARSSSHANHQH